MSERIADNLSWSAILQLSKMELIANQSCNNDSDLKNNMNSFFKMNRS